MSAESHSHPANLAHHFESYEQQRQSASLGVWVFLVTEIMFFGGLFTAYILYRSKYPEAFIAGSHQLDVKLGTINTAVLIFSSLTMAMAVRSAQLGRSKAIVGFLVATIVLGSAFLGIKATEYHHKWVENLIPGRHVSPRGVAPAHEPRQGGDVRFAHRDRQRESGRLSSCRRLLAPTFRRIRSSFSSSISG